MKNQKNGTRTPLVSLGNGDTVVSKFKMVYF